MIDVSLLQAGPKVRARTKRGFMLKLIAHVPEANPMERLLFLNPRNKEIETYDEEGHYFQDGTSEQDLEEPPLSTDKKVWLESSNLLAVGWENGTLQILFHKGLPYEYPGVPEDRFLRLISSESPGRCFLADIQPAFPHTPNRG